MSAPDISRKEKYSRCVALEEDYVHQVYEQIGKDLAQAKDPLEKTVKNFLDELEPGSLVADVGCGDGRHLRNENGIFSLGADNSCLQTSLARQRYQEAILGDNLRLPFRGNAFDAVLSVGVIHHFTTKERRIRALKELARILKIGGRVLIAVQRNNTQISPDVLIPWFDVPKNKRIKERQWLDQDSGEYELEDDRDDDEDEDSISLPSSDEEDAPLTNFAKFFPPQTHHAKIGWNSDRQSRSLDYDYQTLSSSVPNSKQLVQTNVCYAFVRKAFKRFSSVNSSDEDPYFVNDLLRRADSAVPPSPASGIEQKFDLLKSSSFDQAEIEQKVIRDNFIELLNIDDDQDSSRSSINRIYTNETLSRSNSKSDPPSEIKSNLIRSISGMFRNVNSLWNSKETKSCSDLKSQAVLSENSLHSKNSQERRLVRSITTATCNPEFDYYNPLENIEEFDMTVSEANNIVDIFLESSMPRIETVKAKCKQKFNTIASLNHSDIVNGNTLPHFKNSIECLNLKSKLYNYPNQADLLNSTSFSKGNAYDHANTKHNFDKRKEVSFKELKYLKSDEDSEYSDNCHSFSTSFSKEYFLNESLSNFYPNYEYSDLKLRYSSSINNDEIDVSIPSNGSLSSGIKSSVCSKNLSKANPLQNYTVRNPISWENHGKLSYNKDQEISKTRIKDSLVNDKSGISTTTMNSEIIKDIDTKNINHNKISQISVGDNTFSKANIQQITPCPNKSSSKYSSEIKNQVEIMNIKDACQINNSNYKYIFQNSPKKLRKFNQNYNYQMAGSKTLGPFYEEYDDFEMEQDSCLSSYYSMPELHALSEFYQEYNVYQNYLVDHNDIEIPTLDTCSTKNMDIILVEETKKSNFNVANHKPITNNDTILHLGSDNYLQNETLNTNTCNANLKKDLCNSIQSVFKDVHLSENKADTESTSSNTLTTKKLENCRNISSKSFFHNLPLELAVNGDKCRSLTSINSNNLCDPINNVHSRNIINRSRSIDIIHKSFSEKKLTETGKSSNILLEPVSFNVCLDNNDKSNLNLNSQNFFKNKLRNDDSTEVFSNKYENFAIHERRIADEEEHNINLNKRAFQRTNECFEISTNRTLEKNYPDLNSLKKGLGSSEFTRNSSEVKYQSSLSNSPIQSSKFPSPSSEIKKEFMKTHMEENCCTALSESEIKKIFMSKTIRHVKMYDQEKEKDCHLPTILSELEYPEIIPLGQYLSNDKIDFEKSYEFGTNHSEESFMDAFQEHIPETDSSSCEKDKGATLQDKSKESEMKKISVQNISINQPTVSPLRYVDSICSKKDSYNGAKINKESIIRTKLKDASLKDSRESINTSLDFKTSNMLDSIGHYSFQAAEAKENNSSDYHFSHDDKINYSYGWIHEQDAAVIGHRYHHLFEDEELDELIENYISDLHVLNSFHEENHWCVVAEKVRVWTI